MDVVKPLCVALLDCMFRCCKVEFLAQLPYVLSGLWTDKYYYVSRALI